MGKQAARMGDKANTCNDPADMPVGTVIAVGTVMINKMPAAKQMDKIIGVDTHIIMIPSPGGPVPTPLPHPFVGMISSACSTTVNIMGMPAATVDSIADNIPPHIPQGGPFQKPPTNQAKIIFGSADVFIDNGSGGGGGSGNSAKSEQTVTSEAVQKTEGHYLHAKYVDKGGLPISGVNYTITDPDGNVKSGTLTGEIKRQGVTEGSHEIKLRAITKAKWAKEKVESGETVKIEIETVGFKGDEEIIIEIWMKDINRADRLIADAEPSWSGDKITAEWKLNPESLIEEDRPDKIEQIFDTNSDSANDVVDQKELEPVRIGDEQPMDKLPEKKRYSSPQFYFIVKVGHIQSKSGLLVYTDYIEIEIYDDDGKALKDEPYEVHFSNGEIRKGKTDGNGQAKEENCPPVKHEIKFPNYPDITEVD